jgi:hypothetical protein
MKDVVGAKAKAALEKELGFKVTREQEDQLGTILGPPSATTSSRTSSSSWPAVRPPNAARRR